jgi:hypothetical protein
MIKRKNNKKRPPIFLLAIASFFLIVVLSFLLIWFVLVREYNQWEKDFNRDKTEENFVTLQDTKVLESLNKKITVFSNSNLKTDFIEITDREFLYIVGESLNQTLPLNIKFEKAYVVTNKGYWDLYIQTKQGNRELPWYFLRLQKDNTQTAQLYIQKMSIGNFDFTDYGAKIIIEKLNLGIKDALLLINESDFTGRIFRNIELEVGKIIIKGDK